MTKYSVK